ncbi:hypothetical protein CMO91_01540 [Candidatus Woesearchaeota archaeon]|nr:hypothetical protein [Candidatus Woesearchaeota archaeon]
MDIDSLPDIDARAYFALPPSLQESRGMIPMKLEGRVLHIAVMEEWWSSRTDAEEHVRKCGFTRRAEYHRLETVDFLKLQHRWQQLELREPAAPSYEDSQPNRGEEPRGSGDSGLL